MLAIGPLAFFINQEDYGLSINRNVFIARWLSGRWISLVRSFLRDANCDRVPDRVFRRLLDALGEPDRVVAVNALLRGERGMPYYSDLRAKARTLLLVQGVISHDEAERGYETKGARGTTSSPSRLVTTPSI